MTDQQVMFLKYVKKMLKSKDFYCVKDILRDNKFRLKKIKREFIEIFEISHESNLNKYRLIKDLNNWFVLEDDEPYKI